MLNPLVFKALAALTAVAFSQTAIDFNDPIVKVIAVLLLGVLAGIIVPFLTELVNNPRTKFGWDYVVPKLASAGIALIFFVAMGDVHSLLNQSFQVVFMAGIGIVYPGEFVRKAFAARKSDPPVISPAPPSPPPTD